MSRRRIVTVPATPRSRRADLRLLDPGRAIEHAVLRDRGARRDRAFVAPEQTDDTLAELMGRAAVRSFTTGQDDPPDERSDDEGEEALLPLDPEEDVEA